MTLHMMKVAVGVESVKHLAELQARRLERAPDRGEPPVLRHVTRQTPRRAAEILDGGSLYWVIKGFIRVRQPILDIERLSAVDRRSECGLVVDPGIVETELRIRRAFQGWRYLRSEDAPADALIGDVDAGQGPADLVQELKILGLL